MTGKLFPAFLLSERIEVTILVANIYDYGVLSGKRRGRNLNATLANDPDPSVASRVTAIGHAGA